MEPRRAALPGLLGPLGIATLLGGAARAAAAASAAESMAAGPSGAEGVDNLLDGDAVRERMAQPGTVAIRVEADFVTCTQ